MATAKKQRFDPQELIDEQVEQIDELIQQIEMRMKPYEKLNEKKQQLLAARRALLGHGPRLTGGTTTRLTLDDLIAYLGEHQGSTVAQLAEHFSVGQTTISSHIYRNKQRFLKKDGKYWVRNPAEGLNTEDDIEDEDEE